MANLRLVPPTAPVQSFPHLLFKYSRAQKKYFIQAFRRFVEDAGEGRRIVRSRGEHIT